MSLTRLSGLIKLDGICDEPAWKAVEPLPLIMYQPTHGGTPTERTEIRIAYDDHYFYASACFYDSDPTGIRVNSLYRDRTNNDDTFTLIIDTFNDKENALLFETNPAGIRVDVAISRDGGSSNGNWNTYWDVVTVQNEEGWFAEMRIPFSSLGFQKFRNEAVIGLIAYRFIGRKNERLLFPAISNQWQFFVPSQAQEVSLKNIQSQKPVYITPYALGGYGENNVLSDTGNNFVLEGQETREIGLDVKYNITSNLTLDLTVNTDFAQVEADDQMVNLTRFSLFFPEKRQFFQERSGIFSFNTSVWSMNRVFHSRRIGIHEGEAIPILGGARMIGRIGSWDVGFLDMQTQKTDDHSSENFGVLRLRRQVLNAYSYAGTILTSRMGRDGSYNYTYGVDGTFRITNNEYLAFTWAQSLDKQRLDVHKFRFWDASSGYLLFQRRSQEGLNYMVSASRTGSDYLPKMGFYTRQDYTEFSWRLSYDWFMGEASPFRQISPIQCFGFAAFRNDDKTLQSAQFEWDTDLFWKSGASIWADGEVYYEDLRDPLSFPDNTEIPAGSYTFFKGEGGYNMAGGNLFRSYIRIGYGSFYDGNRGELGMTTVWNASRHLELNLQYALNRVRFPQRNQGFDSHIIRLRFRGAVDRHFSVQGFIQLNSTADVLVSNLRMRYNFREGHDLWLVYNEGFNTDRDRYDIMLPRTDNRTVLAKYIYTFQL